MAYVLRELGDWDRAVELSDELRVPGASADDTLVADGILGSIRAFRGEASAARPLLDQCLETAPRLDVISMPCDSAAALAWLDGARGRPRPARASTAASCSSAGSAARTTTTPSGACAGRRASSPATAGSARRARAPRRCRASRPGRAIPTRSRRSRTRSARRRSRRATPDTAAQQLGRAAELHESLDIPFERAQILLRAGVALAAAGQREAAIERLAEAHRTARRLGAAPLAAAGGRRGRAARRVGRGAARAGARRPTTRTPASPAASSR